MSLFTYTSHPVAFKRLSSRNFERQHGFIKDLTELLIEANHPLFLTASIISSVNAIVVAGLTEKPGAYRREPVHIEGSEHIPPDVGDIGLQIGRVCVFVRKNWDKYDAYELAAYVLWRLTQIHPFEDGNGRTANVTAYYIICRKLGYWLPGDQPFPKYWRENRPRDYYDALKMADASEADGIEAVYELSRLLGRAVVHQLDSAEL